MRARFRLYDPGLFNAFRTVRFGQGDVQMIYARHRHTGKWMPQALTFAHPSSKFPTLDSIYKWVVSHGFRDKMPARRKPVVEYEGRKRAFAGLDAHVPLWKPRAEPVFIIGDVIYPFDDNVMVEGVRPGNVEYLLEYNRAEFKKTTTPNVYVVDEAQWAWKKDSISTISELLNIYMPPITVKSTYIDYYHTISGGDFVTHFRFCEWYGHIIASTSRSKSLELRVSRHDCGSWWKAQKDEY